jgi:hypothetical protein
MKSAKPKLLFLSVLLGMILWASQVCAVEEMPGSEQLKNDLLDIKTRLANIELQQKEILAKEDKILEEVNRVRMWVHKR